jgi:hypothetical protein
LESVPVVVQSENPDKHYLRPTETSPRPRASVDVPLPTGSFPQH